MILRKNRMNLQGTAFPLADANGNCVSFIDEAGNVQAHYVYDAFGGTASKSGDMAADFRFRFSSKYLDDETGLLYYGFRFYAPALGRWLSRDPIEERGGMLLYGFVGNCSTTSWDFLGLLQQEDPGGLGGVIKDFVFCEGGIRYISRWSPILGKLLGKAAIGVCPRSMGDGNFYPTTYCWLERQESAYYHEEAFEFTCPECQQAIACVYDCVYAHKPVKGKRTRWSEVKFECMEPDGKCEESFVIKGSGW